MRNIKGGQEERAKARSKTFPGIANLIDDVFRRMNKGSAKNPSYNKRLPVRAVPSPLPNGEQDIKLDLFATSAS